ncbi:MAG: carbohydrate binding family 9 domain-containing protein [Saprospiraceae bacterium]|nr:carbohydrate binding family 9 domain-containing protein [Saprospiraceae bacterium]
MKKYLSLAFLLFVPLLILAQTEVVPELDLISDEGHTVFVHRTNEEILIDGEIDEQIWRKGRGAVHFWQYFPSDTMQARHQTEISMAFDDQYIYVATKCYTSDNHFIIPSLRRDYNFSGSDNISILFDTYNDETNAFLFGINPYGVRREALISNGGRQREDFAESWDNKWFGAAKIFDGYWSAEFAIPFRTLRYKEGSSQWRFNSYRYDTQVNEISTWTQIGQNQIIMDLGHMGTMTWEEPLAKPGTNVAVIPYLTAGINRDFEDVTQGKSQWTTGIGGDAKIGITSGLNLDLTVNPDFSQVEVDQQVTNLDRFEIFLPEKRQFFLENADLFGSFGGTRTNPFFSRRIGVTIDTATGQNIQNSILYGARLSGKLNDNFRLGLLNMQTARQEKNGLPAFNYTVAALQQNVFSRSNISMIMVNKQATGSPAGGEYSDYNRVLGFEYRLATPSNRWTGKFYHHQVFSPGDAEHKFNNSVQLEYLRRDYRLEWAHLFVGEGYDAEVGFVPRRDYLLISPEFQLFFYPNNKRLINRHSLNVDFRNIYKVGKDGSRLLPRYGLSDRQLEIMWELDFADNSRGSAMFSYDYIFLLDDFDPTRSQDEDIALQAGTDYKFANLSLSYSSDQRKKLIIEITPNYGSFYSGKRYGVEGSLTYRYQPLGFVSMDYAINHLRLGDPFEPSTVWLIGPRIDLTFSKSLFLTAFVQYNSQFDNLNINTRFQWRFRPVSDFFLVYTDNYLFDPFSQFSVRNRGLVAKLTYWL